MKKPINSATVFSSGDPSVGIPSVSFKVELYVDEVMADYEYIEEIRQRIKVLYDDMTGDNCSVMFDYEIERQNEMEAEMDRQQAEHEKEMERMYAEQESDFGNIWFR